MDHNDVVLPAHQGSKSCLNVLDGQVLPGLAHDLGVDPLEASDGEVVLQSLILSQV